MNSIIGGMTLDRLMIGAQKALVSLGSLRPVMFFIKFGEIICPPFHISKIEYKKSRLKAFKEIQDIVEVIDPDLTVFICPVLLCIQSQNLDKENLQFSPDNTNKYVLSGLAFYPHGGIKTVLYQVDKNPEGVFVFTEISDKVEVGVQHWSEGPPVLAWRRDELNVYYPETVFPKKL